MNLDNENHPFLKYFLLLTTKSKSRLDLALHIPYQFHISVPRIPITSKRVLGQIRFQN